jgi:hypothetical protein
MKEFATTKVLVIPEILPKLLFLQIKELSSLLEQRELFSCGTCLKMSYWEKRLKHEEDYSE